MSIFSKFSKQKGSTKPVHSSPGKAADMSSDLLRISSDSSRVMEPKPSLPIEILDADPYFKEAALFTLENDKASIGAFQRLFKIGFNRAAHIMDQLCDAGIVGPEEGTKPRKILVTSEEFKSRLANGGYVFRDSTDSVPAISTTPSIDSVESIEEAIRVRFKKEPSFNTAYASKLLDAGNVLIPKADYDLPLDFVEKIVTSCHPKNERLLLLDSMSIFNLYNGLPQLLLPVVSDRTKMAAALNWAVAEMESRKNKFIESGVRDFSGYCGGDMPIVTIIIRELYDIIRDADIFSSLQTLLPVCNRFGINIIAFSMYDMVHIQLRELAPFLNVNTPIWCRSFMEGSALADQQKGAHMDTMSGIKFEQYCSKLLGKNGFTDITLTKTSGDFGGDVLATKDQIRYVIQCKRYDSNIGVHAVQEVIASRSIYKAHVGVVMTNMHFSAPARTLAKENNIILWDRDYVMRMAGEGV